MSGKRNKTFGFFVVIFGILLLVGSTESVKSKVSHKLGIAKDQHPTCKTSDMLHSDIVTNGILHRKQDNFTFLGRVRSMKECLGLCCTYKKCELAYLVNNTKCYSRQCTDPELCKIVKKEEKSPSKNIKMSLMVRNDAHKKVYVTAYIIMAMSVFGAALSGTVWIAYVFVKKYKEKKIDEKERERLSKEPQVY